MNKEDVCKKLETAECIIKKYKGELSEADKFEKTLEIVRQKMNEKELYLAVIGEFSNGKSSFINALLRDKLLDTGILQGTTDENAQIVYSPFKFSRKNEDGTTTHGSPAKILEEGIVLIDTPGTNSDVMEHEKITKSAICELADAALFVLNAEKPLEATFEWFIEKNMPEMVHNSIFVLTKMDRLSEEEGEQQIEWVRNALEERLGVKEALVLPYSSLFVMSDNNVQSVSFSCEMSERERILCISYASECQIVSYVREHKLRIQNERLEAILNELMGKLDGKIKCINYDYMEKSKILEKHIRKDKTEFAKDMRKKYFKKYDDETSELRDEIKRIMELEIERQKKELKDAFFDKGVPGKKYLEKLPEIVKLGFEDVNESLKDKFNECRGKANAVLNGFGGEAEELYNELERINVGETRKIKKGKVSLPEDIFKEAANDTDVALKTGLSDLCGVGSGIIEELLPKNAFWGHVSGWLDDKQKEIRDKIWNEKISPEINRVYEELEENVEKRLGRIRQGIGRRINEFIKDYGEKIDALAECDKENKRLRDEKIAEMEQDIKLIRADIDISGN